MGEVEKERSSFEGGRERKRTDEAVIRKNRNDIIRVNLFIITNGNILHDAPKNHKVKGFDDFIKKYTQTSKRLAANQVSHYFMIKRLLDVMRPQSGSKYDSANAYKSYS